MCEPQKRSVTAAFVLQNLRSWSVTVPFFTLLIVGLAMDSPSLPTATNTTQAAVENSQWIVELTPIDAAAVAALREAALETATVETARYEQAQYQQDAYVSIDAAAAYVDTEFADSKVAEAKVVALETRSTIDDSEPLQWHLANLVKPDPPSGSPKSSKPIATKVPAKRIAVAGPAACACPPVPAKLQATASPAPSSQATTSQARYIPSAAQYTSIVPSRSLSMYFVPKSKISASSIDRSKSSQQIGMSDEEIRRRTSYSKAKNRALARANKMRQSRRRRTPAVRKRKTLNLAQYKAILASKYGINRLVEHYNSASSIAPFGMRHVGQHLGLGGGNLEGTGYSARSPYEALAFTSYANLGLPVLYRGVAKGSDGYYAYQIYRK